jgi:hypothetical protein
VPANSPEPVFSSDVVAAVLHHMNDDHLDDNLLIAKAFGSPDAESSTMTTLDEHGGTWVYATPSGEKTVTVPWTTTLSERPDIRREVVVMYRRACGILGIDPREH